MTLQEREFYIANKILDNHDLGSLYTIPLPALMLLNIAFGKDKTFTNDFFLGSVPLTHPGLTTTITQWWSYGERSCDLNIHIIG